MNHLEKQAVIDIKKRLSPALDKSDSQEIKQLFAEIEAIQKTGGMAVVDLSGINLKCVDLSGISVRGLSLEGSNLTRANFEDASACRGQL